jgi:hypothetical protein
MTQRKMKMHETTAPVTTAPIHQDEPLQGHWSGEVGKKLQVIADWFRDHKGESVTVREVAEKLGTTDALVAVFVKRHPDNFTSSKDGRVTRWSYGVKAAKPARVRKSTARKAVHA